MPFDDQFLGQARRAHKNAFKALSKNRPDPDLEFYQTLGDDDWMTLISEYGITAAKDYREHMEKKLAERNE